MNTFREHFTAGRYVVKFLNAMAQENEKNDLKVEDRRHFDKEGNPIRPEEAQESTEAADPDRHSQQQASSHAPKPAIDFASLTFIYVQTALIHLGELDDPVQNKTMVNLEAARQIIDILELLQAKTKGNLTTQEDEYLEKTLFDLRLLYVQKAKKP